VPGRRNAAHVQKSSFRRWCGRRCVNEEGWSDLLGREDGGQTQKSGKRNGGKPRFHIDHSPEFDRRFQRPQLARVWNRFHSSGESIQIRSCPSAVQVCCNSTGPVDSPGSALSDRELTIGAPCARPNQQKVGLAEFISSLNQEGSNYRWTRMRWTRRA
jgi:hypothetical protein